MISSIANIKFLKINNNISLRLTCFTHYKLCKSLGIWFVQICH